jgi:hypothetical protein
VACHPHNSDLRVSHMLLAFETTWSRWSARGVQIINKHNKANSKQNPHHVITWLHGLPQTRSVSPLLLVHCWCDTRYTLHATWLSAVYFTLLFQNTFQISRLKLWGVFRMECIKWVYNSKPLQYDCLYISIQKRWMNLN